MKSFFHIAAGGGFDLFVWVIIIVATIIAQIVKAGRKPGQPTAGTAPRPGGGAASPQDEIRDFLESLSGGQQAERPTIRPVPPPPRTRPVAMPIPPPHTRPVAIPIPPPRTRPVAMPIPPPPAKPKAAPAGPRADTAKPVAPPPRPAPDLRRRGVVAALGQRESLRHAFVLREILGPPPALRRSNPGG